jgi:hypothetical protein
MNLGQGSCVPPPGDRLFMGTFAGWVAVLLMGCWYGQTAADPPLTADAIMARVAANQDRGETLRKEYVYHQHIHIVSKKPGAKLMREETTDYQVVPSPDGTKKVLQRLRGRYLHHRQYLDFTGEPAPEEGSLDAGLIRDLRDDLASAGSKDGLGRDLFPHYQ